MAWLAALVLIPLVAVGLSAQQPANKKPAAKKPAAKAPANKKTPAKKSAATGKKSAKTKPAAKATKKPQSAKSKVPAGPRLPTTFMPPAKLPRALELDNSLLTDAADLAFKKKGAAGYRAAMKANKVNEAALQAGIRWTVARLTMKKNRQGLKKTEVLAFIRGQIVRNLTATIKAEPVRQFALKEFTLALSELLETSRFRIRHKTGQPIVIEITREGPDGKDLTRKFQANSLDELRQQPDSAEAVRLYERYGQRSVYGGSGGRQNLRVQINVAFLLSELNAVKGRVSNKTPDIKFTPAIVPLCDVVDDPYQLDAVKLVAVRGIVTILASCRPEPTYDLRLRVARSFDNRLKRPFQSSPQRQRVDSHLQHIWLQERLVNGLAASGILIDNKAQDPFVDKTLGRILSNPKRHWMVRAAASQALGRAALIPGQFPSEIRAYQVVELAYSMAAAYNLRPRDGYWGRCFWRLYFVFKQVHPNELASHGRPAGLLNQVPSARMRDAYDQVLPLVAHVIIQPVTPAGGQPVFQPVPADMLKSLSEWMNQNRPANYATATERGRSDPASAN